MNCEPIFLGIERLRNFTQRVFEDLGVPEEDARIAADVLIEADLRGFDCHGVSRLFPTYTRIRRGLIEPRPQIDITWVTPTTGCCDGGNGLGMVVGHRAMQASAMKGAGFRPRDDFDRDFELLVEEAKASPREPGIGEIFIPGEPEALAKQKNRNGKVPVLPQIWKKLKQIAVELNLPLPDSGAAV